jgi:arylsulfatase A-like enzyme
VVDTLVEHFDLPATLRELSGAAPVESSEGRSLRRVFEGEDFDNRKVSVSENWGFASFETDRYRLVVDEDAVTPCQLFDLVEDPAEDHDLLPDQQASSIVECLMDEHVRPFFRTAPARPTPSIFTG